MPYSVGDTVEITSGEMSPGRTAPGQLAPGQLARIIQLTELFGQPYADVFIEPDGPVWRVPVADLRPLAEPLVALGGGHTLPAHLFVARLAAHQLQAMLTQQGVLSAANFRVTPLPHQVLAVDFVLGQFHPRAMLADEVGLGKTIEAAMVYEELKLRHQVRRALVIVPAGLTRQWQDEFTQKFGEQFIVYDRTLVEALREIHGQETNLWKLHDQVITSLDFVKPRRVRPDLSDRERQRREEHNRRIFRDIVEAGWDVVIFDEAHKLSKHADGSETARYRVGEALAQAVPVFLLLTATPHQGDAVRFLHLLNLVDPYGFNQVGDLRPNRVGTVVWRTRKRAAVDGQGHRLFKQRVTDIYPVDRAAPEHAFERALYDAVTNYVRENYGQAMGRGDRAFGFLMILFQRLVISSSQAIHESLARRLNTLLRLQAALEQAARADRSSEFDEEAAEDDDAQAVLDELLGVSGIVDEAGLVQEIEAIQHLLDLARRAGLGHDAKMVALLDIIDEVCRREGNPSTKFLVFTEFVATQQAIQHTLEGMGYRVAVINGRQKLDQRIAARQDFAGRAQFLVSTDAGGEGINLQFCHVMVNYDLPWNPMKLEQRIGRLDRIGQAHDVLVLNLLVEGTVEGRVRQILEAKLALIRQQYGADKLADILSTLQDEFHFDRLYMDALLKRQAEDAELEQVAQQVYERARHVLEQDEFLLPQMQNEPVQMDAYRERLVEVSQDRVKAMLEGYLAAHGEGLREYSRRPGVYYFDLPGDSLPPSEETPGLSRVEGRAGKTRHSDVVFDRERAVADDGLTYLHLNHPVIQHVLGALSHDHTAAVAQLRVDRFSLPPGVSPPDGPGLWAIYRLRMTNHDDVDRQELVSVFIDQDGRSCPRLARALLELTPDPVSSVLVPVDGVNLPALRDGVRQLAEAQASDRFSEAQLAHAERLAAERKKMERYYRQQEGAVAQIAIENIRLAKQRELLERRRQDLAALDRRVTLVPDLAPVGMAVMI